MPCGGSVLNSRNCAAGLLYCKILHLYEPGAAGRPLCLHQKKMKNIRFTLLPALVIILASCNKEKTASCNGGNLCFTIEGNTVTVQAVRKTLPDNRNRLYWEEGSGNNYRNIEIDIYGTGEGDYAFSSQGSAGSATFQYYVNNNGSAVNTQGVSGTLRLITAGSGGWSGTFSGTVNDGTAGLELSNGSFNDVQP